MKFIANNYSLVIIGNSHNPTVISDTFFIKSGIVSDLSEIDRNNLLITPAFCQAILQNNTSFIVEPGSLKISSSSPKIPFEIGNKYCSNLGFIKSIAIGINFDITVEDYDFERWFKPFELTNYRDCSTSSIIFTFRASPTTKSNVTVTWGNKSKAMFKFNFHADTYEIILSDLNIDFVSTADEYYIQSIEFIKSLLQ